MRVLYIINSFSWGGAEKLVYDLSIELKKKVDFVGVAALYLQNDNTEKEMISSLNESGVKTLIVDKKAGKDRVDSFKKIFKFAKENKVSVIHGHCSVPMVYSEVVGKLLRIPVVCTIHSTKGYSKRRERLTSWMANKYISIGEAAEEYIINELGIKKKKVYRIYNAINTEKFISKEKEDGFWTRFGGNDDDLNIINVARVHEAKNQLCLLQSIKKSIDLGISNIKLYILGYYDKDSSIYHQLIEYIGNNNLENNVTFLGMHNNVVDFLNNSDCFVMTSSYEGLSVAFLEAVITGLPIISTDLPFVQELNKISECATVVPQNDSSQIARLLHKKGYFKQRKETIQIFSEMFSLNKFVDEHLEVYKKV